MVGMATSFASEEQYDDLLDDHKFEDTIKLSQKRKEGTPLNCWGRAGYKLPNLNKIFVPRHLIIVKEKDTFCDPAFRILFQAENNEDSFSFYDAEPKPLLEIGRLNSSVKDADENSHVRHISDVHDGDTNHKVGAVFDGDDIYYSDDSASEDNSESENDALDTRDINSLLSGSNHTNTSTSKINNSIHRAFEPNESPYSCKSDPSVHRSDLEDSTEEIPPITFVVEVDNDQKANTKVEVDRITKDVRIANYALQKKLELEEFQSRTTKKKQVKGKKKKHQRVKDDQLCLADLEEMNFEASDKTDSIDKLHAYYQNYDSYDVSTAPVASNFDFPKLEPIVNQNKVTATPIPKQQEKIIPNFRSIAEEFIPASNHKSEKVEVMNESCHRKVPEIGILKIENIPHCLSIENLRAYLSDFGKVEELWMEESSCNNPVACVIMDCDMEWVVESLHGNSLTDDSSYPPMVCYIEKEN